MYDISVLDEIERQCILRFLYQIAQSDYKVVPEEKDLISKISTQIGTDILGSEYWLIKPWNVVDSDNLFSIMKRKSADFSGWLVSQAINMMNADNIKHQNEQVIIMNLVQNLIGNPAYTKAIFVPIDELDEVMIEMLIRTPELCNKKGTWWQKKKGKEKAIKRVGASLSWEKNGKIKFVTAVNYELTTPGGSRCAEQNAIGLAIATEPGLKFEEIREIVIYGGGGLVNPCWPCGVCMENLRKLNKSNQIKIYGYPENYIYARDSLPKTMLQLSVSELSQRKDEK